MIMTKTCEYCGKPFQARRSHAKTCSEPCRGRLNTRKRRMAAVGDAPDVVLSLPGPLPDQPSRLVEVTERALSEAGKLDTPIGLITMVIATQLGSFSPLDNASGLVALSKELDRLLAIALQGNAPPDELDDLERRRRLKAARAGL